VFFSLILIDPLGTRLHIIIGNDSKHFCHNFSLFACRCSVYLTMPIGNSSIYITWFLSPGSYRNSAIYYKIMGFITQGCTFAIHRTLCWNKDLKKNFINLDDSILCAPHLLDPRGGQPLLLVGADVRAGHQAQGRGGRGARRWREGAVASVRVGRRTLNGRVQRSHVARAEGGGRTGGDARETADGRRTKTGLWDGRCRL
jgi:hypothetical protein